MTIRPVGAELLHAEGRHTYMTKLIVAFRNSANALTSETERIEFRLLTHKRTSASEGNVREQVPR